MSRKPPPADDALSARAEADMDDIAALVAAQGMERFGFWQHVVDTMNEGLLLVDRDRRIVYLNKKGEELVGAKLEQVRGQVCVDAINCPQCQCCCRLFEEGGAERIEVSVFGRNDQRSRVLLKNGRLLRDNDGNVLGGVETFTDITKEVRQRRENEQYTALLFQQKTRIDALLGAMDEGVFSVDGSFRVRTFAPRMSELLGIEESAAIGKSLHELLALGEDVLGVQSAVELDGRVFRIRLPTEGSASRDAELSFRRVRMGDDEMLGILRVCDVGGGRDARPGREHDFHGIISRSEQMRDIFRVLEGAAQTSANILVEGESGVGKELVARAIHRLSPRSEAPFYAVNCATFAGSLLLSELFGHERGAFTGAFRTTKGKLELAGNGTLFLDEISEIPLHYQAVLLRVLEDRQFERVGGQTKLTLDARIISATNERLTEAVKHRRFREDLYFRLKVIPIHVPPLRQRREDIPLLANYFANHPAVNLTGKHIRFTDEALAALSRYHWPGNVRELRNLVEYLCFSAGDIIDVSHFPQELRDGAKHAPACDHVPAPSPDPNREKAELVAALEKARYRKQEAARLLGIDRTTLWRKMKRLGVA